MASDNSLKHIQKYWKGHVIGTNRGKLFIRIKQKAETLKTIALFKDEAFGPALVSMHGNLSGLQTEMHLDDFWSLGLIRPLDGKLTLNFSSDFSGAEGKWETDIGTSGICKISAISGSLIKWWASIFSVRWSFFLRKYSPLFYTLILLIIAILGLFEVVKITYPALILLLIPSPYIYRTHLGFLIHAYRVRRIGPVELEQKPYIDPTIATHPIIAAFKLLDQFFVHRTKLILYWLVQKQTITYEEFEEYAKHIGVPIENIEATRQAIIMSGCATYEKEKIIVTEFGKQYIAYLTRLTSGVST